MENNTRRINLPQKKTIFESNDTKLKSASPSQNFGLRCNADSNLKKTGWKSPARTHTRTQAPTHTNTLAHAPLPTHACSHKHTDALPLTNTHSHKNTHTQAHTPTNPHTNREGLSSPVTTRQCENFGKMKLKRESREQVGQTFYRSRLSGLQMTGPSCQRCPKFFPKHSSTPTTGVESWILTSMSQLRLTKSVSVDFLDPHFLTFRSHSFSDNRLTLLKTRENIIYKIRGTISLTFWRNFTLLVTLVMIEVMIRSKMKRLKGWRNILKW